MNEQQAAEEMARQFAMAAERLIKESPKYKGKEVETMFFETVYPWHVRVQISVTDIRWEDRQKEGKTA